MAHVRRQPLHQNRNNSSTDDALTRRVLDYGWIYRPRIEIPGGYYHVGSRGNNKQPLFLTDDDRSLFLLALARASARHAWRIHAYCLMTNHYHVVLQLTTGGLSGGMCELNGGYALSFNARYGRSNHLFGRRFWDEQIESDSHFFKACRYVVLNPVRAGLVRTPEEWPWRSYRATVGLDFAPPFLVTDELLSHFGPTPASAREAFIGYVSEGRGQRQPLYEPPAT